MIEYTNYNHFYVTLPSNSSKSVYGKQPPGNYVTALKKSLVLNSEEWEVGLAELVYTRSWRNVNGAKYSIYKVRKDNIIPEFSAQHDSLLKLATCAFPEMHYASAEHMVSVWNECAYGKTEGAVQLLFAKGSGRVTVRLKKDYLLVLNTVASMVLGFGEHESTVIGITDTVNLSHITRRHDVLQLHGQYVTSPLPVRLDRMISSLYVYTDVVEPQLVGDAFVPLLRVVGDPGGEGGETITRTYDRIHYGKISRSTFDQVRVHITDDQGKTVAFEGGRVTVKLHFRKKKY
jgi:hypothetical protein